MLEFLKEIWQEFQHYMFPFSLVHSYEMGVRLTLGKNPKILGPGLRFKLPFLQEIFTEIITADTLQAHAVHVTTLDKETISVSPAIEYTISDVKKWIIDTNEARGNLHDILRGIVADYFTGLSWEDCKDKKARTEIKNRLNKRIADMGAVASQVMLTDICKSRVIVTQI